MGLFLRFGKKYAYLPSKSIRRPRPKLNCEELESRVLPAVVCNANPTYEAECNYLSNLIPASAITITAQQSGNWSNPATWEGRLPGNGDNVWIPNGVTVTVDGKEPGTIRSILDNGTLQFAPNVNTSLTVDTLVVGTDNNPSGTPEGVLTIGTAADPIQAGVKAVLTFADEGSINTVFPNDPEQLSRGLISMNTVSIYGSEVTPYTTMSNVLAGATTLQLAQVPVGWQVGDELLLPGTNPNQNQDEQDQIAAISGTTVTLATPLAYAHTAPAGQNVYVADEARNVILQSAAGAPSNQQGCVMFMHTDQEVVAYADFLNLGRTNKAVPLNNAKLDANGNLIPGTGTNEVGRYAVHFHRDYWPGLSDGDPPILVLGNFEKGSPGWGYDNHSSDVDMEYNVAFDNFGAGFSTEAGNEIGTFNGNLAVGTIGVPNGTNYGVTSSRTNINDFGFVGSGFWMQSPGCTLTNNIALDNQIGFDYYNLGITQGSLGLTQFWSANAVDGSAYGAALIPVQSVQMKEFSGNSAAEATDGLEVFWNLPVTMPEPNGVQSTVNNFTAWDVTNGIVPGNWDARMTIQNSNLSAGAASPGIGINNTGGGYASQIVVTNTNVTGFKVGEALPTRGPNQVSGGYWDNQTNFEIPTEVTNLVSNRQIRFSGSIVFGPDSKLNYSLDPQTIISGDPNTFFVPQQIILPDGRQLYYSNQLTNYVPFATTNPSIPTQLVGLTNQQLWQQYRLAMEGVVAPADAVAYAGSNGVAGTAQPVQNYYRLWSPVQVSSSPIYTLQSFLENTGSLVGGPIIDPIPVTLQPGWNVITRTINGTLHSWLVNYNPPAQAASLSISGLTYPQLTGTPVTITVRVLDGSGNLFAGYTGTVTFSSSDPNAVRPANYTFTAGDKGTHTFTVTFNTAGTQSLTVADVAHPSVIGVQTGIKVSQPAPGPVLLQDNFADDNGTTIQNHKMNVGPGWTVLSGTWVIENNHLNLTDNQAHGDVIAANAGQSNVQVSLNFTTPNVYNPGIVGIVLRAVDSQNFWLVELVGNQLYLYQVQNGLYTMMAGPVIVPVNVGTTYTLKAVANGPTITVYLNGTEYLQFTGATFLETATMDGIFSYRDPAGAQPLVPINSFECDTV